MRCFALLLVLLYAPSQVRAQGAPPPASVGETLRLTLSGDVPGTYVVGRVQAVDADALVLYAGGRELAAVPWSRIAATERRGHNRTGEVVGLLVGALAGAAAGYSLGPITGDPLASAAFVPGALVGLTIGGVVGARSGDRWHAVASAPGP